MGRPLLSIQLERYYQLGLTEAVIVANPENESVIRSLAGSVPGLAAQVVVQPEPKGMGDALLQLRGVLSNGSRPLYITQVHDLTDVTLHERMLTAYESGAAQAYLAGYRVSEYFPGGYLMLGEDGQITDIIEKPGAGNEPSDLDNVSDLPILAQHQISAGEVFGHA